MRSKIVGALMLCHICVVGIAEVDRKGEIQRYFINPVLWADFPDPDAIRVDDTYYMVSTSMHYFPGVTILESKDLLNWHIASNAVEEFKAHPYYDMNGGFRYARGQWASSIRYIQGQFYVLFNTLDEGAFICTAKSAYGPWKLHKLDAFLYDPGLFVDNDGRIYVIHGNTTLQLTELNADGLGIKNKEKVIYQAFRSGLEGNHCYHIGEYYYIYCTYGGAQGTQICLRSKSIDGPYEEKEVLCDDGNLSKMNLHQGCLLSTPEDEYWSLIFQDRVGLGRIPFLVPVRWVDNWPILGRSEGGTVTFDIPFAQKENKVPLFQMVDDFSTNKLGHQWQFNHNPDKTKYSLEDRKGYLRLYTATITDTLKKARNTVCQRIFGPYYIGLAEFDLRNMKDGDCTGIVILQDPYASIGIFKRDGRYCLNMKINEDVIASTIYSYNRIFLKAEIDAVSDIVRFFYSNDNKYFYPLGSEFKMEFNLTDFCGNRVGLFNYAEEDLGGFVDINFFKPQICTDRLNRTNPFKKIELESFDYIQGASLQIILDKENRRNQMVAFENQGEVTFLSLDFGKRSPHTFVANVLTHDNGSKIELWRGKELLERYTLPNTKGELRRVYYPISFFAKTSDLRIVVRKIKETEVCLDWFMFDSK